MFALAMNLTTSGVTPAVPGRRRAFCGGGAFRSPDRCCRPDDWTTSADASGPAVVAATARRRKSFRLSCILALSFDRRGLLRAVGTLCRRVGRGSFVHLTVLHDGDYVAKVAHAEQR